MIVNGILSVDLQEDLFSGRSSVKIVFNDRVKAQRFFKELEDRITSKLVRDEWFSKLSDEPTIVERKEP